MTAWDYFVGFEREPEDLDTFLDEQGYDIIPNERDNSSRNYESREGGLVELFYFPKAIPVNEGEAPDWSKSGFKVTSELMISTKEFGAVDEALRITQEAVRKYDGILYDDDLDNFFRRNDL